ncbi:AAA family ATPase [Saccharopolyspora phatthalungensis]|uniref:Nuclease SbcCD subunit C n=1 Tax=Saccharopolyspora phatthalungensis TaxID=664693 RepID=A0A840Q9Z1_9PSEU|nr:AAA family ATPase [Saccharopolyspora phatthalungensis]MBB5153633.1 recombinational DNA repair ATPase RecF [Saccharopolyspora phatthalungensis]
MDPAFAAVHEVVLDRVAEDSTLPEPAKELVLAALEGSEELDAWLSGTHAVSSRRDSQPRTGARGVFLRSISVTGFRGVSSRATLHVEPGPGLTLVAGRNGSGKSSFAEAAELALTGGNARWNDKPAVWQKGWRNLHHTGQSSVELELVAEGAKPTHITWSWADDNLSTGEWSQHAHGEKRRPHPAAQWQEELVAYRPFLPYSELGKLINGRPSDLYDSLHRLLGLDSVRDAIKRLSERERTHRDHAKDVRCEREQLRDDCLALNDERAQECAVLLGEPDPDLTAVANLVLGDDSAVAQLAALRRITGLKLPSTQQVANAVEKLTVAIDKHSALSTAQAEAARNLAVLIRHSITHHKTTGDGPCPVCGHGTLNATWRRQAEHAADEHERHAKQLHDAQQDVTNALAAARELIQPVPEELQVEVAGVPTAEALHAWREWHALRTLPSGELSARLIEHHRALSDHIGKAQHAAISTLEQRNEIWQPLARRLSTWHDRAARLREQATRREQLTTALKWLTKTNADLRRERWEPFAEESQRVWRSLRQQSNVDLGDIKLAGGTVQRRVDLDVSIDGTRSEALSVMSQGELHALGLALFLPRATVDRSPFRFIVIDDPVQAMDPAKVDGLAHVLAATARTRQVVVFTHDARLTEAVRRLQLPATVWEVCRRERSQVEIRKIDDPADRYLADARALSETKGMPSGLCSELVANFCRAALEATSEKVFRARRLGNGDEHSAVESLLANAVKTHHKLTLAVLDDPSKDGELYARLRLAGPRAVDTVRACKQGAHRGHHGDLRTLINDTERLVRWLEKR